MASSKDAVFLSINFHKLAFSLVCITTEDDEVTPSSSSLSPGGIQAARQQPQATISLSSVATLNLPTANTARKHLGTTKKSESR